MNPTRTMTPHDFIARWNGADDQARSRKTLPGLLAALGAVARGQKHADGIYSAA